jgi:hypothetical protein
MEIEKSPSRNDESTLATFWSGRATRPGIASASASQGISTSAASVQIALGARSAAKSRTSATTTAGTPAASASRPMRCS